MNFDRQLIGFVQTNHKLYLESPRRLDVLLLLPRIDMSRLLARRRTRIRAIDIDRTLPAVGAVFVAVASVDTDAILRARRNLGNFSRQICARHLVDAHLPTSITSPNEFR